MLTAAELNTALKAGKSRGERQATPGCEAHTHRIAPKWGVRPGPGGQLLLCQSGFQGKISWLPA